MVFLNKRLREYELSSSMIWVIRQWSIFCVVDIYTLVFQFPVYRNYTSVDPNSLISKFRLKRLIWSNTRRPPHQTTPTRIWWEPKGAKTTSEPKKAATPTNTKAARSKVALRTPTVNCLRKNNIYIYKYMFGMVNKSQQLLSNHSDSMDMWLRCAEGNGEKSQVSHSLFFCILRILHSEVP